MKISASFLKIQNDKVNIQTLAKDANYLHYDIMDGYFTSSKTLTFEEMKTNTAGIKTPKDIHLMVENIYQYVDKYATLKPEIITFHFEATKEVDKVIEYIKAKKIKVGLALNPDTPVTAIIPYLKQLDLVLVMSVEAGAGGQPFIDITDKLDYLDDYRKGHHLNYLIEVDGGLNPETISKVSKADIIVVGSYITNSHDYHQAFQNLKSKAFTLAELMGVIVILSILAVIVTVAVDISLKNSRFTTCEAQETSLIEAAKIWSYDHPQELPQTASESVDVFVNNDLIAGQYMEEELTNPMTEKPYSNSTKIKITTTTGEDYVYTIEYGADDKSCQK